MPRSRLVPVVLDKHSAQIAKETMTRRDNHGPDREPTYLPILITVKDGSFTPAT